MHEEMGTNTSKPQCVQKTPIVCVCKPYEQKYLKCAQSHQTGLSGYTYVQLNVRAKTTKPRCLGVFAHTFALATSST
jgi:hypothetical protein